MKSTPSRGTLGVLGIVAATFMGQADAFVATLAAPLIQADLRAGFGHLQLIGASYVLATAAVLVTGARLGDRYGRRRVFLIGVVGFALASLGCATAAGPGELVVFRALQGLAAGIFVPQELALLNGAVRDEAERARAMSWYGAAVGLGVVAGLAGGGALIGADIAGWGWRAAFLINVPLVALIVVATWLGVGEQYGEEKLTPDLTGSALTAIALPVLLVPVLFGPERDAAFVATWLGIALLALGALTWQQRRLAARGGRPVFAPHLLRRPGVAAGLTVIALFFAGNAGLFLIIGFHIEWALGLGPTMAGLIVMPLGLGFAAGSWASERAVARWDERVAVAGCLGMTVVLFTQAWVVTWPIGPIGPTGANTPSGDIGLWGLAVTMGGFGLAQGLVVAPLLGSIFRGVPTADAGALSGLSATLTQCGLAIGYAVTGLLYRRLLGVMPGLDDPGPDQGVSAYAGTVTTLGGLAALVAFLAWRRRARARTRPGSPVGTDPEAVDALI